VARFTIIFTDMFLLVRRSSAPSVILPVASGADGPHFATASGAGLVDLPFSQNIIWFARQDVDGSLIRLQAAAPSTWPGDRVLKLAKALGQGEARVRKNLLTNTLPVILNARIDLPPGTFVDQDPYYGDAGTVSWHFGKKFGSSFDQTLTDTMTYSCAIDDTSNYALVVVDAKNPYSFTVHPLSRGFSDRDISFEINNSEHSNKPIQTGAQTLDEYGFLYDLMDYASERPLPTGTYQPTAANTNRHKRFNLLDTPRPICGGGQGCPDPPDASDPCQ